MSFDSGETVGPYRVMEKLGQGGMASVFKAYHPALDRFVALKVMHRAFSADENFMARFQREARVVAKLEHPNIVPIYDFAEHNGNSYLVMKYIEGETLKARLRRKVISPEEGLAVIKSVGSGLAYAHEQGILHRDVKPSNVILADDGKIYLTDFGLARIAAMGESTLSSDTMLGTPQYISPEQAMGKRDLDAGTDIYSFGVLIYELVVGDVPFRADTPIAIVHDHIYTPLPLPREKNPNVPEAVERILLKALAKERADRFDSVNDLVAVFLKAVQPDSPAELSGASVRYTDQTLASGSPGVGGYETLHVEAEQKKRLNPWIKWLGIGAVLVVMCLCLLLIFGGGDETEPQAVLEPTIEQMVETEVEPRPEVEDGRIDELIQKLEDNADDPMIHLELSGIYMRRGMVVEAQAELDIMMEMVAEDEEFFRINTQRLMENESYLLAFRLYLHYAETHPGEELPSWVKEGIQTAGYLGARNEMAPQVIFSTYNFEEPPGFLEPGLLEIMELRHLLYRGNRSERLQVEGRLVDLIDLHENVPTAHLLYGEVLLLQEEYVRAEEALNAIFSLPNVQQWVIGLADYFIENLIP